MQYFNRALKLDRHYLSAWTLMGHEYVEIKNVPMAIGGYARRLTRVSLPWVETTSLRFPLSSLPEWQWAHGSLESRATPTRGVFMRRISPSDEGGGRGRRADAYRRGVDINPLDYRAWYGLGQTYEILQMPHYALYYFQYAQPPPLSRHQTLASRRVRPSVLDVGACLSEERDRAGFANADGRPRSSRPTRACGLPWRSATPTSTWRWMRWGCAATSEPFKTATRSLLHCRISPSYTRRWASKTRRWVCPPALSPDGRGGCPRIGRCVCIGKQVNVREPGTY